MSKLSYDSEKISSNDAGSRVTISIITRIHPQFFSVLFNGDELTPDLKRDDVFKYRDKEYRASIKTKHDWPNEWHIKIDATYLIGGDLQVRVKWVGVWVVVVRQWVL